jgi:hypothetical protein
MSGKFTVNLKRLGVTEKGRTALARIALEIMEEQARNGISATGAPHGQGRDKPIDLHDTGRLWRDVILHGGQIKFQSPYSAAVNERFPFNSIAPQYREEFLRRVAEALRGELAAEE